MIKNIHQSSQVSVYALKYSASTKMEVCKLKKLSLICETNLGFMMQPKVNGDD